MSYNISQIFAFLRELKANNHKEWMDANRSAYEAGRKEFKALAEGLSAGLSEIDRSAADAKIKYFRINRDIRFSKDKSPYKVNFSAVFTPEGRHSDLAGYYFHLQPGMTFAGGGSYMPPSAQLKRIRQEIDYCGEEFAGIVEAEVFTGQVGQLQGETLKTAPKGYAKDHPQIGYLRHKGFYAMRDFSDEEATGEGFVQETLKAFSAVKPLVSFLNRAFDTEESEPVTLPEG